MAEQIRSILVAEGLSSRPICRFSNFHFPLNALEEVYEDTHKKEQ